MTNTMDSADFNTLIEHLAVHNNSAAAWAETAAGFKSLWRAVPTDMRLGLMAGVGMINSESAPADGVALLSYLSDRDPIIRIAQYNEGLMTALRMASRDADIAIRRAFTDAQTRAVGSANTAGRIKSAIWKQTHDLAGGQTPPRATPPLGPRPHMFFAPDLPDVPIFDDVPWAADLNAQTEAIRDEFLALMHNTPDAGAPYVPARSRLGDDWAALKGQKNWNAVHLFQMGQRQAAADKCPRTLKALANLPLVYKDDAPMEVFFSVLAPGVTIPPHYGVANVRTTVHLPLIVPRDCAIRVGDIIHHWNAGETFVFDDSFDHTAWNKSEDTRVVLIFEAWRPDMTAGEIAAVEASYSARDAFIAARDARVKALWPTG